MRTITNTKIEETVCALFKKACICPPKDVTDALIAAKENETSPRARDVLDCIIKNNTIAETETLPCCQDTGMAVVFVEVGQDVHIEGDLYEAIHKGVSRAYTEGYFRKSVLTPITRKNTGDNTPAVIHTSIVKGDKIKIIAAPKGFGSENMSRIAMLKPSMGVEGIKDFLVDAARQADANPCPPVVLGVGIGGTFELAALMAKRQLLRPVGTPSHDPELAAIEKEVKDRINALKIGPMGLGGDSYCLAVNIESYPTHLAGLPVAVNFCCHALRHAEAEI